MKRNAVLRFLRSSTIASMLALTAGTVSTTAHADGVVTIQDHLESLKGESKFNIDKPIEVFEYVFSTLSDEVKVYPTENYFYWQFYKDGISYSGNIRLDALDRDKGIANFAYFTTYNRWNEELVNKFAQLGTADGLKIQKISPLRYQLTFKNKSVIFQLNDLTDIKPPADKVSSDEKYLGPVFDESGLQFYLLYNSKVKVFHYVLNREGTFPEMLSKSRSNDNILIGHRTGFAFYRDPFRERLILVGVYDGNSMVNNYFDGPFDQLPDNFLVGNDLQNALIDQTPQLKGQIDRFGNTNEAQNRVLIAPYMHYSGDWALGIIEDCVLAAGSKNQDEFYQCMDASTLVPEDDPMSSPEYDEPEAPKNEGTSSDAQENTDKE